MRFGGLKVNLVLSGGGIKGLAYAGVFQAGERRGFRWGNIAGVSAGAMAGAFAGAGYSASDLLRILGDFNFKDIKINEVHKKVPAVSRFMECYQNEQLRSTQSLEDFLNAPGIEDIVNEEGDLSNRGFFSNLITFSKEGCLLDGDYLEEWVYKTLRRKGVKTFADLRGGICDEVNPRGYRVRMTAVDATRKKVIVLPDDIVFYDMNPDKLEVAKAVRMSTSVPMAFKPVEIKKTEGDSHKTYHLVDGGVIDNFPFWLIGESKRIPTAGFKLSGGEKKKGLSLDTPLSIFKSMITATHDIGIPEIKSSLQYIGEINTEKVKFLDFDLGDEEKLYLFNAGKKSGMFLFETIRRKYYSPRVNIFDILYRFFGRKYK